MCGKDLAFVSERDVLLLELNNEKVCKENLERRLTEKYVVSKMMVTSMKHIEKSLGSLENEKLLEEEVYDKVLRSGGQQTIVARRSVKNLVESIFTRSIGIPLCISSPISKWSLRDISELDYSRYHLCRNLSITTRRERDTLGGLALETVSIFMRARIM